jgi:hypothetical protein
MYLYSTYNEDCTIDVRCNVVSYIYRVCRNFTGCGVDTLLNGGVVSGGGA